MSAKLSVGKPVMSQPSLSAISSIEGNEHAGLVGRDTGSAMPWSKDESPWKRRPARAAGYVWARKWHMLFFVILVATSVPLFLMAKDGVFSPGLLVICSATMLAWVMFQGIERERRRAAERNKRTRRQDV